MPFGREPTKRISVFCRKKLTAKEEMSSVAGSALRSGRKATRSVDERQQHRDDEGRRTASTGSGRPKSASSV